MILTAVGSPSQSNRLTKMEGLQSLVNLRELYLSHNGIEVIEGLENNVRHPLVHLGGWPRGLSGRQLASSTLRPPGLVFSRCCLWRFLIENLPVLQSE